MNQATLMIDSNLTETRKCPHGLYRHFLKLKPPYMGAMLTFNRHGLGWGQRKVPPEGIQTSGQ
jgi:hypothetical protein